MLSELRLDLCVQRHSGNLGAEGYGSYNPDCLLNAR